MRERTAELQKLNAELDSFAYTVSHDLKSPLRTIDGFTRLIEEQMGERLNADEREMSAKKPKRSDASDFDEFARMLAFLRRIDRPPLRGLAHGVVGLRWLDYARTE